MLATDSFSLSIAVDYFNIKVTDIIARHLPKKSCPRFRTGDPTYAGLVTLTPGTNDIESIIQTLAERRLGEGEGFDLEANFRENIGPGRLNLNMSGTYMMHVRHDEPRRRDVSQGRHDRRSDTAIRSSARMPRRHWWGRAALEALSERYVVEGPWA